MSLINRMLLDLDEREQHDQAALAADVDTPRTSIETDAITAIVEANTAEPTAETDSTEAAIETSTIETGNPAQSSTPDVPAETKGKFITDGLKPVATLPLTKRHRTSGLRLIALLVWTILLGAMISAAYFGYIYFQQSRTAADVTPSTPAQSDIAAPVPLSTSPIMTEAKNNSTADKSTGDNRTNDHSTRDKNTGDTNAPITTTKAAPLAKPQGTVKSIDKRPSTKVKSSSNKPAVAQADTSNVIKKPRKPMAETQADHLYAAALNKYKQGRIAESKQDLHKALQHHSQHTAAREMLAGLLIQQQHYSEAGSLLAQGMTLAPEHHPFNFMLARLLNEQGQSQQAIAALEQALVAASDNADYLGLLAVLYQRSGQYELAVTLYQQALQLRMNHAPWWLGLAMSLDAQQQWQQAADAFQRVLTSQQLQPRLKTFAQQRLQAIQKIIGADTAATTSP